MSRHIRNLLELGHPYRVWAEWLVIAFVLSVGFFSVQALLWYTMPDPIPPCGTGQPTDHCAPQPHPSSEMRWDQGYLNQFRAPCPAVYDAPNGNLRECL
jgi:hypothetical protein